MIDVNVLFGATPWATSVEDYGLEAARAEIRGHGIAAALVTARSGVEFRHEVGNDETFAAVERGDAVTRLYPIATINPVQFLDWRAEVRRVLATGAVGFRLFPREQGWEVDSEAFRQVAEVVLARRPLLVPLVRFGDASRIGAVTAGMGQPVVLLGGHYTQLGDCLSAMERWPHLHLETSRLGQFLGVETVVRSAGAERLLFGSGCPEKPIQSPLNAVLTARIPDAAKRSILSGNAARLFGIPAEPFDLPAPTSAADLIDVHGHVGPVRFSTPAVSNRDQAAIAAGHGIALTVASSIRAIMDDQQIGNDDAFRAVDEVGGALRPYVVVNPNDPRGSCEAMDLGYARGAAGAKLHCQWSRRATASPEVRTMIDEVARRGLPLKIHNDGAGWPEALADAARAHPRLKVIVAHGGPGTPSLDGARVVEQTDNVYLELATTAPNLSVARQVVRRIGPDRLLFGSDAPLIDAAHVLGLYADAGADLARTTAVAREVFSL